MRIKPALPKRMQEKQETNNRNPRLYEQTKTKELSIPPHARLLETGRGICDDMGRTEKRVPRGRLSVRKQGNAACLRP